MKLHTIGSNQTEVAINSVGTFLFSYNTCVAAKTPEGCFKTDKKHSVTTSKHINAWGAKDWDTKPQAWFDSIVEVQS